MTGQGRSRQPVVKRDEHEHERRFEPFIALREIPRAHEPVPFLGPRTFDRVPGYVFLCWDTAVGVLAAAYPVLGQSHLSRSLWVREFDPSIRCLIQVADRGFQAPDGPDVFDQSQRDNSDERRQLWRYFAQAIGQPAPYWPWDLNFQELIEQWKPGNDVVIAVPEQSPDMTPLLQLSALYEHGSPTHRVLTHYYLKGVRDASVGTRVALECLADSDDPDNNFFTGLRERLVLAARAPEAPAPDSLDDLGEHALRAVFSGLMERRDTLAVDAVRALRQWGVTEHMPFATLQRHRVENTVMLEEWLPRLQEVPGYLPNPGFAGLTTNVDRPGRRFLDPATGAPVLEGLDYRGEVEEYVTLLPRRLPATSPLAELIIDGDGHGNWIRVTDGTLYPAPAGEYDVSWGYRGSGYGPLVERLLDDITTPPIDRWIDPSHTELTALTKTKMNNGTVLTRAQLETAREQPKSRWDN
ncbi:hypothetical protein [Lentzea pudingi]|uniref:hypothetical protein n=1 Tax=Lentzea pudingi TaxID=1789439 RepID=UPI001666AC7B|nr:hypothetical protein [Lentzea pudingi]